MSCPSWRPTASRSTRPAVLSAPRSGGHKADGCRKTCGKRSKPAAAVCPSVTLRVVTGHRTRPHRGLRPGHNRSDGARARADHDAAARRWRRWCRPGPVAAHVRLGVAVHGRTGHCGPDLKRPSQCVSRVDGTHDHRPTSRRDARRAERSRREGTPTGIPTVSSVPAVRARTVSFAFSCSVTVGSSDSYAHECAGRATVDTTEWLTRNGRTVIGLGQRPRSRRHRVVVIGRADFLGRGGAAPQTISVKLDSVGTRLLARFNRVPATVTVVATVPEQEELSLMAPIGTFHVTFTRRSATQIGSRKCRPLTSSQARVPNMRQAGCVSFRARRTALTMPPPSGFR